MKYIMLIYQGGALEQQAALSEDEQKEVYATTVRVEAGKTLTTDRPAHRRRSRSARLPLPALDQGRTAAPPRPDRRGARHLPTGQRTHRRRPRTPLPGTPSHRTGSHHDAPRDGLLVGLGHVIDLQSGSNEGVEEVG